MRRTLHPKRIALLQQRARLLRAHLTESELALWHLLRERPCGFAFKKQVQVGGFIADFLAPRALLIVEVDGDSHRGRERADARRDRKLARLGYRVLRLPAELVLRDPAQALALLSSALARSRRWPQRAGLPRHVVTEQKRPSARSRVEIGEVGVIQRVTAPSVQPRR